MADTIDQVSERLTRLEVTVAQGFLDNKQEFAGIRKRLHESELRDLALDDKVNALDNKVSALDAKVDRNTETLQEATATLHRALLDLTEEVRRKWTTE